MLFIYIHFFYFIIKEQECEDFQSHNTLYSYITRTLFLHGFWSGNLERRMCLKEMQKGDGKQFTRNSRHRFGLDTYWWIHSYLSPRQSVGSQRKLFLYILILLLLYSPLSLLLFYLPPSHQSLFVSVKPQILKRILNTDGDSLVILLIFIAFNQIENYHFQLDHFFSIYSFIFFNS